MLTHQEPPEPLPEVTRHTRQLNERDLAAEVALGKALVIVRTPEVGLGVYDVSKWIHIHPGGELAIRHFIGGHLTWIWDWEGYPLLTTRPAQAKMPPTS
jgi:hypothetical protein